MSMGSPARETRGATTSPGTPLTPSRAGHAVAMAAAAAAQDRHTAPAAEGFGVQDESEMDQWMKAFTDSWIEEVRKQLDKEESGAYSRTTEFGFLDVAPYARSGVEAVVSDSFTQCFVSRRRVRWNWNFYLAPLYVLSVVVRYGVMVPLRLLIVAVGMLLFGVMLLVAYALPRSQRRRLQEFTVRFVANVFLLSWCAVVHEHNLPPLREAGQVYVANHTSVIDIVMLLGRTKLSITGQAHGGVIGFFQNYVLQPMHNVWFDRMQSRDRAHVAQKIREHVADVSKPPLLVFPEGTCVNNEHIVMFKRGAFELATSVVPVAIKYNKTFVDAFWNSRAQSFPAHLFSLWSAWAVVCDVWYLEPQYRREDETSIHFAQRVKELIAKQAGLTSVPWDGYLKYFKPKPEYLAARKALYESVLIDRFGSDIVRSGESAKSPSLRRLRQRGARGREPQQASV